MFFDNQTMKMHGVEV